jgi:hypothetical protein
MIGMWHSNQTIQQWNPKRRRKKKKKIGRASCRERVLKTV